MLFNNSSINCLEIFEYQPAKGYCSTKKNRKDDISVPKKNANDINIKKGERIQKEGQKQKRNTKKGCLREYGERATMYDIGKRTTFIL